MVETKLGKQTNQICFLSLRVPKGLRGKEGLVCPESLGEKHDESGASYFRRLGRLP